MHIFDKLRSQPLRRTGDGLIAGICSGLGHRWGISPILVRLLAVIGVFFAGLVVLAYGVAWLLLPRDDDGEIVLEDAVAGHLTGALAGATATLVVGTWAVVESLSHTHIFFSSFFILAAIVVGVIALVVVLLRRRDSREARAAYNPAPYSHSGFLVDDADSTAPNATSAPLSAPKPTKAPSRPRRPKAPAISGRYILGTIAIALVATAVVILIAGNTPGGILAASGAFLGVIGAAMVIAGIAGRRATWLTTLAALVSLPVAALAAMGLLIPTKVLTSENVPFVLEGSSQHLTSFIDARTTEVSDIDDGTTVVSAFSDTRYFVSPDDAVVLTFSGTGNVMLQDFGGWKVERNGASSTSATPHLRDSSIDPLPADEPVDPDDAVVFRDDPAGDYMLFDDTVTLRSPAAQENPSEAKHVKVEFGFGSSRVRVVPPQDMSDGEWLARELGYEVLGDDDVEGDSSADGSDRSDANSRPTAPLDITDQNADETDQNSVATEEN